MIDKPREAEREAYEHALASNPNARFWNATDAMFWAWQARAALAQQDAQAVPQGYKLVPVEPTPEMKERSQRAMLWAGWDAAYAELLNAAPTPPAQQTQAATDVLTERRRQIDGEGWTSAHDDEYLLPGSLAEAAACYAISSVSVAERKKAAPHGWPWAIKWWKPTTPRRDLVKAGALILAEIERLDRAHATPQMQQLKGQSE